MNTKYANAYKEVLCVINNLIKEDYEKISKEYIEFLKENCNNEYKFEFDKLKPFNEQQLLDDTKYILFGLFEKFGATDIQKAKIKSYKINYQIKLEEQKRKKYNPEVLELKSQKSNTKIPNEKIDLIEYKEKRWYKRLLNRILKIFNKR